MARQKGIIKFKGTMGDISFYRTSDGYQAREKGGIDKDRIKNDPAFQRTRENGLEFGRAGAAGKLLRTTFRPLLQRTSDSRVTGRLTREMLKVIKADATNARGERNVVNGEPELLEGFEFNGNVSLGATLYAPYEANIDRAAGTATITIPAFVPQSDIVAPSGATHAKLVSGAAEIDFENNSFVLSTSESAEIAVSPQTEAELSLENALTEGSTLPMFMVLGVEFFQEVNGIYYPLNNGAFNVLTLVAVEGVA